MNLILKNSKYVKWYTNLAPLFLNIPDLKDYTYFISDLEINGRIIEPLNNDMFISGTKLSDIVTKNDIQFCWGVFSAFKVVPNSIEPEIPFADCNPSFWKEFPTPQARDAEFEIVCFDSESILFIGVNDDIGSKLNELYPDIKDLDEENKAIMKKENE